MKPSKNPNEATILDTLPECKVVLDALNDPDFPQPPTGPTDDDLENSFGNRFRRQTMHERQPYAADAIADDELNPNPRFTVLRDDAHYVLKAAERVLGQKSLVEEVINRRTGRTKAAKEIIRVLAAKLY